MQTNNKPRTWAPSLMGKWIDHPIVDWIVAAASTVAVVYFQLATFVTIHDHSSFYQTIVGVSLGLLSLGSISVTLLVTTTPTGKLKSVHQEAGRALIGIMLWCLVVLVMTTFALCSLYLVDLPSQIIARAILSTSALSLMILSTVRLLWLLYYLLTLMI